MENTLKNSEQAPSLEKMEALKKFLDSRIMGQDKILSPLCDCLKFGMLNLNTPGRPRGTLFLLGPTGVGKTESIRSAVEYMYGTADRNFLDEPDRNTRWQKFRENGSIFGTMR